MADYFLDSSAVGKNYHVEVGTAQVERLLKEHAARHFISRLSVIELQSVFARKVRMDVISEADFQLLRRRFLADVTQRRFRVVRMTGFHYQEAERLIKKYGISQSLRTLDALQLSVALDLRQKGMLDCFVCADKNLGAVARLEGLSVLDPEQTQFLLNRSPRHLPSRVCR
jgi:predicted nucleic acid-binding protein